LNAKAVAGDIDRIGALAAKEAVDDAFRRAGAADAAQQFHDVAIACR
jgi:hypothetical protein